MLFAGHLPILHCGAYALVAQVLLKHPDAVSRIVPLDSHDRKSVPQSVWADIMEPACFGLPVIFGPRHLNSYEALLMIQRGGAFPVEKGADVVKIAERLIKDESFLHQAGQSARAVVIENLGATGRTLEALSGRFSGVIGNLPG